MIVRKGNLKGVLGVAGVGFGQDGYSLLSMYCFLIFIHIYS